MSVLVYLFIRAEVDELLHVFKIMHQVDLELVIFLVRYRISMAVTVPAHYAWKPSDQPVPSPTGRHTPIILY